ncbi:hypothetical protein [Kumtagia ephedrae]|jgi:hypothetical protein|uniref:Transmemrbane protein n=1 Tax=Kumtagia ephedrae TaxID=2116701 RepID=A0A2P7RSB6_9HYPH|nr:hypothetical protein [Mesorhizobium ephedrae]PSJ53098.1 hypothetical protein C7I84_25965 [Mesorhizobium ephedrae]
MTDRDYRPDDLVETIFRNGTLTVVGIVLAFSLGFLSHWAANPIPWEPLDGLALGPMLIGICFQIKALADLLDHKCLRRRYFERANRIFLTGLILTAFGVAGAILLDFFEIAEMKKMVG